MRLSESMPDVRCLEAGEPEAEPIIVGRTSARQLLESVPEVPEESCYQRINERIETPKHSMSTLKRSMSSDDIDMLKKEAQAQFWYYERDFETQNRRSARGLGYVDVGMGLFGVLLNLGIFSIPKAFHESGLLCGTLAVILVPSMCIMTARQLGAVFAELRDQGQRADFASAGKAIGGKPVAVFMHCWCLLELMTYAIIMQVTLNQLSQHSLGLQFTKQQVIGASCVAGVAACALSNTFQARVCSSGAFAVLISCLMVFATGWEMPVRADSVAISGSMLAAPLVMSLVTFTVAAQPVLPTFYASAKDKESFDKGCVLAWGLWILSALGLCIFCSIVFGSSLQDVMLKNVGRNLQLHMMSNGRALNWIMAFWMVFRIQAGMAVLTRPHTEMLARACGITLSESRSGLVEMLLAVPVFLLVGAVAVHFSELVLLLENVCGAFLMGINGFIFPAVAYLRVCRPSSVLSQLGAYIAIIFGTVIFFAPLWSSWLK